MAENPVFVVNDPVLEKQACIDFYEADTGRSLNEGDPEMRIVNMITSRMTDYKSSVNSAGLMMLLPYSVAPILDYIVSLVGVTRLPAAFSQAIVLFTFPATHDPVILPKNMRVQSSDGKQVFQLNEDLFVAANATAATGTVINENAGIAGNGYLTGSVNVILDPQPFLLTVSNTTVTNSGSDTETDVQLRERAMLAPNAFSVAGPVDAYIYFAKSANPLIIDVAVPNPPAVPGTVVVYPLVPGGGVTPTEILNQVSAILSSEKVRPLCDTVVVQSPTKTGYSLVVKITKMAGAVNGDILAIVNPALINYTQQLALKLGRDVLTTRLKKIVCYDDTQVYDCAIFQADGVTPFVDIIVNGTGFAYADSIAVSIVGSNAG